MIFIDFDFYLLATPGCNYTRKYTDFILSWKLGAYKAEEDFKTGCKEKIRFFRFF